MHLPAAAIRTLTHAHGVNKSKGAGRNISASRVSHFPPQSRCNRLILFHSSCVYAAGPEHFPCNIHSPIFVLVYCVRVYTVSNEQIRFHFPSETHQQVKIQFKNNKRRKQQTGMFCRPCVVTEFTKIPFLQLQ